jgi:hypothetical protein
MVMNRGKNYALSCGKQRVLTVLLRHKAVLSGKEMCIGDDQDTNTK